MQFLTVTSDHHLREPVKRFIRSTYLTHYGAWVPHFPKVLIALVDGQNRIHCAAGLRDCSETFFSEHYLDAPIERIVSDLSGTPVACSEIVEITSLASQSPARSMMFVSDLIQYGEQLGFNWALFTATRSLGVLLKRMGVPLIELAAANGERVPMRDLWGTYYKASPWVFVIRREDLMPFLENKRLTETVCEAVSHG